MVAPVVLVATLMGAVIVGSTAQGRQASSTVGGCRPPTLGFQAETKDRGGTAKYRWFLKVDDVNVVSGVVVLADAEYYEVIPHHYASVNAGEYYSLVVQRMDGGWSGPVWNHKYWLDGDCLTATTIRNNRDMQLAPGR